MYKIYTHSDLDGLGCAILANLAFGVNNIDIEYCKNPEDLSKRLLDAYQNKSIFNYNLVYITDCSIPKNDSVLQYVNKYNNVRLFDHHQTALYLNKEKNKFGQWANVSIKLNNKLTCGTELWYNFLKRKNMFKNKQGYPFFVEQIRLLDTWDWAKNTSLIPYYFDVLVNILGVSTFVSTYTDRLNKKDINELTIFNQYERDLIDYEVKKIDKDVYNKEQTAKIITMSNNKKYIVSFVDRNQSVLGNKLCSLSNDDDNILASILFNLDKGTISFRSLGENDCSKIANLYSGGGHKNASGGYIDKETIDEIIGLLMKKLGSISEISSIEKQKK